MYFVPKSIFVRSYNEDEHYSNDRIKRFQSQNNKVTNVLALKEEITAISKKNVLVKTDWVIVDGFNGIARILEFRKNDKSKIKGQAIDINHQSSKNLEMSLAFYVFDPDQDGILKRMEVKYDFVSVLSYKFHVPKPKYYENGVHNAKNLTPQIFNFIKKDTSKYFESNFGSYDIEDVLNNPDKQPIRKRKTNNKDEDPEFEVAKRTHKRPKIQSIQPSTSRQHEDSGSEEDLEKLLCTATSRPRRKSRQKKDEDFIYI